MYFTMQVSIPQNSIVHLVTIIFSNCVTYIILYFEQMFNLAIYQYSIQCKLSLMFS